MTFYTKNSKGDYIPIDFKKVFIKDWENSLVLFKIGNKGDSVSEDEVVEILDSIDNADALGHLYNTSFLVSTYNLDFKILGNMDEVSKQFISIRVTADDDLSKLGELQKNAKEQLRDNGMKSVVMPSPLTVEEYKEVMDIKQRCDIRRNRRG